MDYITAYTEQKTAIRAAHGNQPGTESFGAHAGVYPWTPVETAVALSDWYARALPDVMAAYKAEGSWGRDIVGPYLQVLADQARGIRWPLERLIKTADEAIEESKTLGGGVVSRESSEATAAAVDGLYRIAQSAAKALSATKVASIAPVVGPDLARAWCGPIECCRLWDSWLEVAIEYNNTGAAAESSGDFVGILSHRTGEVAGEIVEAAGRAATEAAKIAGRAAGGVVRGVGEGIGVEGLAVVGGLVYVGAKAL